MKLVFITGASSGIGYALATLFLEEKDTKVVGISRRNVIKNQNYRHEVLDLAVAEDVNDFEFFIPENTDEVLLINNAGSLGEVGELGSLENENISRLFQINTTAPIVLMNSFLKKIKETKIKGAIVNISSGAAQYPVKGWSNYCASKAALNMATEVLKEENPEFTIYGIAPGIVDTKMQEEIRSISPERFKDHQRFVDYFKNGSLSHPNMVAHQIINILRTKDKNVKTIFSLKS